MQKMWFFSLVALLPLTCHADNNAYAPLHHTYSRPHIDKIEPPTYIQVTRGQSDSTENMVIYGRFLYPTDDASNRGIYGIPSRTTTVTFQALSGSSGGVVVSDVTRGNTENDQQALNVQFSSSQFLSNPGQLLVTVTSQGWSSNPYTVNIIPSPTTSPTISGIKPTKFKVLENKDENVDSEVYYRFHLSGNSFDAPSQMTLMVGGYETPIENLNPRNGTLEGVVPSNLWDSPGEYQVTLTSPLGASNAVRITIFKAPPPKAAPEAPAPIPTPDTNNTTEPVPDGE